MNLDVDSLKKNNVDIGDKISFAIRDAGLSVSEAVETMRTLYGVYAPSLSAVYNHLNDSGSMRLSTFIVLCDYLNLSADQVLFGRDSGSEVLSQATITLLKTASREKRDLCERIIQEILK